MLPEKGVLIGRFVVMVPAPGVDALHRLERRNARREPRPYALFEPPIIHLPVERLRLFRLLRGEPTDEVPPLRPEVEAGRIDRERRPMQRFRGRRAIEYIHITFARPYRE